MRKMATRTDELLNEIDYQHARIAGIKLKLNEGVSPRIADKLAESENDAREIIALCEAQL